MKPTLVILAAGMGSRYGGLKQIDAFGPSGETIIEYSVFDAIRAGFGKIVFVIRKSIEEEFRAHFGQKFSHLINVQYVFQELDNLPAGISVPEGREKPWGTGHAVLVTKDAVKEPFAVINADDFYGAESFQSISEVLSSTDINKVQCYLLGYQVKNTLSEFGSVSRGVCNTNDQDELVDIIERTNIYQTNQGIVFEEDGKTTSLDKDQLVSMNFMAFSPAVYAYYELYFNEFIKANIGNLKSEFYMPYVLNRLIEEGLSTVKVMGTTAQWFGVTYKEDKEAAVNKLNVLIKSGKYPANLWK